MYLQSVTVAAHFEIVMTLVVYTDSVYGASGSVVGYFGGLVSVAVTGQTVVYKSMTTVVTWGRAGQSVTVAAHEVTV